MAVELIKIPEKIEVVPISETICKEFGKMWVACVDNLVYHLRVSFSLQGPTSFHAESLATFLLWLFSVLKNLSCISFFVFILLMWRLVPVSQQEVTILVSHVMI